MSLLFMWFDATQTRQIITEVCSLAGSISFVRLFLIYEEPIFAIALI